MAQITKTAKLTTPTLQLSPAQQIIPHKFDFMLCRGVNLQFTNYAPPPNFSPFEGKFLLLLWPLEQDNENILTKTDAGKENDPEDGSLL